MRPVKDLRDRARTKTVATLGPASRTPDKIRALIAAGVDVFRINTAHGDRDEHDSVLAVIRQIEAELGLCIGVLVDLAGPKIRLGKLVQDPTDCPLNAEFSFVRGTNSNSPHEFTCNYERLVDELNVGNRVMLADGTVTMTVVAKSPDAVRCKVISAGLVRSRQGINLPGAALSVPAMTDADISNALWAANREVDFISLSFVRSPAELQQLKKLVRSQGSSAMIVAKIEKGEALEQLQDIVLASDGVMVARGDLGVEIDIAETPVAQKRIIHMCQRLAKPVIVATQMLDSMQHSRQPTRAEVNDVANSILDGADACMLSGETAIGEYPVETVEMMNRIMCATEQVLHEAPEAPPPIAALSDVHPITAAAVAGASHIAEQLSARLMVIVTHTGGTARVKSKHRDGTPVVAISDSRATLRQMCLFWGVIPLPGAPSTDGPQLRKYISEWGVSNGWLEKSDRGVYLTGTDLVPHAHNVVVVFEVE